MAVPHRFRSLGTGTLYYLPVPLHDTTIPYNTKIRLVRVVLCPVPLTIASTNLTAIRAVFR